MLSINEISELLADLYAAPLQVAGWQAFFNRLSTLTQLSVGYLHCCRPGGLNFVLAGGGSNFSIENIDLYNRQYAANDPHRAPLDANPRVGAIRGEELISRSQFLRTELYNDLLSRHDAEYLTVLTGDSRRETAEVFSLYRGRNQGPMNDDMIRMLELLVPHVRNALALHAQISAGNSVRLFSEAVMESMSIAAVQVANTGTIQYMNALAAKYLRDEDGLRQQHGTLVAGDAHENRLLYSLIAKATARTADQSLSPPGGAMQVQRRAAMTTFKITVVAAPKEHRLPYNEPSAIVFISDPSSPARSRASILQQMYGLTPTEARVANALLEGLEIREVGDRLSLTYETTRFYVKRVMTKTGTRRQAELIRLILSLPGT